jgi:hypothetical protein
MNNTRCDRRFNIHPKPRQALAVCTESDFMTALQRVSMILNTHPTALPVVSRQNLFI